MCSSSSMGVCTIIIIKIDRNYQVEWGDYCNYCHKVNEPRAMLPFVLATALFPAAHIVKDQPKRGIEYTYHANENAIL